MKRIAIITARSGSKGLKDKNIMDLRGRPLIDYTIRAALDSGCFDEVMVSTDSQLYADISIKCGASVPFLRSAETSGDTAGSWDVVREVLRNYEAMGQVFDQAVLLQPTSPLRTAEDITGAFRRMEEVGAENMISVVEVEHPIQWCVKASEDLSLSELAASPYWEMRRQDLPKHYRVNGAIYIVNAKKMMDPNYAYMSDKCYGYIMEQEKSVDIDTITDFCAVEAILNHMAAQE